MSTDELLAEAASWQCGLCNLQNLKDARETVAEPQLDHLRRLLPVELHLAAAIERGAVGDDRDPSIVGIRLDPGANPYVGRANATAGDTSIASGSRPAAGRTAVPINPQMTITLRIAAVPPPYPQGNRCAIYDVMQIS
jgi:hypothetical protein